MTKPGFYMVTIEDIDGQWFSDPKAFREAAAAQKWAADNPPPEGYSLLLYRCTYMGTIT